MDTMLTDRITAEIEELRLTERHWLSKQLLTKLILINILVLDKFVAEQLAKEVKELHADRTDL